tara:strand:- start:1211 stop:1705 length:495 start_codon:yes stop_codon:yes gene_type:complete
MTFFTTMVLAVLFLPIWPFFPSCHYRGLPPPPPYPYPPLSAEEQGYFRSMREWGVAISGTMSSEYANLIDKHLSNSSVIYFRFGNTVLIAGGAWLPFPNDTIEDADIKALEGLIIRGRTEGDPYRQRMPENIRQALDEAGNAKTIYRKNCVLVRALSIENWGEV